MEDFWSSSNGRNRGTDRPTLRWKDLSSLCVADWICVEEDDKVDIVSDGNQDCKN